MSEVKLIDMLSYLDIDLLNDDYIEGDLSSFAPVLKNAIFILAGLAVAVGVIGLIMNKKTKFNFKKTKFPKVLKLATSW